MASTSSSQLAVRMLVGSLLCGYGSAHSEVHSFKRDETGHRCCGTSREAPLSPRCLASSDGTNIDRPGQTLSMRLDAQRM